MRRLGRTGLMVSDVGFGAWQLGGSEAWGAMSDATACGLIHKALDLSCNLFDTAPNYGNTNSERLLGEALAGKRDQAVLVSKFGHVPGEGENFSAEAMWKSLHDSLKRLKTDWLDVFLLHSPPPEFLNGSHPIWDAMRRARDEGKIRFFGASVDVASEIRTVLDTSDAQVLEILFNVFHQDARLAFSQVREKQTGILTKVPLDSGWLTGKYSADSQFTGVRARWTEEQIRHRAKLVGQLDWLTTDGVPLSQKAIGYLLAYPEVSSVIPGCRSIEQMESNLQSARHVLSETDRARLERFWEEFTGGGSNPLPW
ncbi:MAG: aldo/keto reductase [Kiritimatiellales bacterium]|nr:aldo/keto reductase [Kiritimatiellota bacterium]MBL7012161.1 aldo/keto reductase [Kiritimatiellales bacterium]